MSTDTTVVNNNNTTVNTNTTVVVPTPTPTPTPTPPPVVVVDTTTVNNLKAALTAAIKEAAASTVAYPKLAGTYYYIQKGFTPSNSTYYFWQFGQSGTSYNLDVSCGLKSVDQTCVTTETTPMMYTKNSDGTTWCTNRCLINGKDSAHNSCSYIMNTKNNVANWQWSLTTWTYA